MKLLYTYDTSIGPFYIAERGGRFHPIFDEEALGSYDNVMPAVEDLAGGHTFSISTGQDTANLGIPEDISEGTRLF
jgi:hypothetical protein